jgi:hypothetical protein
MPLDAIERVARRIAIRQAATAGSCGVAAGILAATLLVLRPVPLLAAVLVAALVTATVATFTWRRSRTTRGLAAAAAAIERVHPSANVIVTAEELQRHPERAPEWIRTRVIRDAGDRLNGSSAATAVPLRKAGLAATIAAIAVVSSSLVLMRPPIVRPLIEKVEQAIDDARQTSADVNVKVTIVPPAYAGRASVTVQNPLRLEALEGSVIRFDAAAEVRLRVGERELSGPFLARESGYFVIGATARRLIPLIVTHDSAPVVTVEAPGKDLLLPPGDRRIPLTFTGADDLGLDMMELRFTKVTGSGEQFEFQEGRLPVDIERVSAREWRGRGALSLSNFRLQPGDSLVYRIVARDRRPDDAGLASSDTYIVEIAGPGQVPLEGVEMPPDMERYALSQQMVVLKLERLQARERSIAREALLEEVYTIAAEQRAVRANFIFLMGGHVEDEEVEAEQSHEIQEGRLENTARREINAAIAHMTRVEQGLAAVNIAAALPPARRAVEALQRAFGRSRYLLRALAVRSPLDLSRRLTGDTTAAGSWNREREHDEYVDAVQARDLFDRLVQAARALAGGEALTVEEWQNLAESALRIDPTATFWQETSQSLAALGGSDHATAHTTVERITASVSPHARRQSLPRTVLPRDAPLPRAWLLEQRR